VQLQACLKKCLECTWLTHNSGLFIKDLLEFFDDSVEEYKLKNEDSFKKLDLNERESFDEEESSN